MNMIDAFARRMLLKNLSQIQTGRIVLRDAMGCQSLGRGGDDLLATVDVAQPRFYRRAILGGSLGVAEAYCRQDWTCADLVPLFRIFLRNMHRASALDRGPARIMKLAARVYHARRANRKSASRRNIEAHYDLGNDFFSLLLDETMAYSSGIFPRLESSLHDASLEKIDRVCRKLNLRAADHLLEIGTGWGGLAIHAASHYGCRVTTTTISTEQFRHATRRVEEARLTDRVTVLAQDYRDLRGAYDKLVSIEMIEAVGHQYLDQFFQQCSRLLKPAGTMLLQAILMPDQGYASYLRNVDFIQRYVFPGGCLPSLGSILGSISRVSDLKLVHCEEFAAHYARTLRAWHERFVSRQARIEALGYSTWLRRMFDYYLGYCQAAFEERYVGVAQLQFDKPGCRRDAVEITRWAAGDRTSESTKSRDSSESRGFAEAPRTVTACKPSPCRAPR